MSYSSDYPDQITVRLPPHWKELLREDAREFDVTLADLMRVALDTEHHLVDRAHKRIVEIRDRATLPYISSPDTWSGREDPDEEYERELMRHELG